MKRLFFVCLMVVALLGTVAEIVANRNSPLPQDLELRYNESLCAHTGLNPFYLWTDQVTSPEFQRIKLKNPAPNKKNVHCYTPWHVAYTWFYGNLTFPYVVGIVYLLSGLGLALLFGQLKQHVPETAPSLYWAWTTAMLLPPIASCCVWGNYGMICTGLSVVLYVALLKDWQFVAGIAWGLMMTKPQAATLFVFPLLFQRKFRTIVVAALLCGLATLWPAYVYGESPLKLILQIPKIGSSIDTVVVYKIIPKAIVPFVKWGWTAVCALLCAWMSWRLRSAQRPIVRFAPVAFFFPVWMYSHSHDHIMTWFFVVVMAGVLVSFLQAVRNSWIRRLILCYLACFIVSHVFCSLWSIGAGSGLFVPTGIGWLYQVVSLPMSFVDFAVGVVVLVHLMLHETKRV